jgi:hypothetical protein
MIIRLLAKEFTQDGPNLPTPTLTPSSAKLFRHGSNPTGVDLGIEVGWALVWQAPMTDAILRGGFQWQVVLPSQGRVVDIRVLRRFLAKYCNFCLWHRFPNQSVFQFQNIPENFVT